MHSQPLNDAPGETSSRQASAGQAGQRERPRATVMGLGLFGGGLGAVRYLCAVGYEVAVTDLRTAEQLRPTLDLLQDCQFNQRFGGHSPADFVGIELLVVSPAISPEHDLIQLARSAGARVTSEMNLFWERNCGRTVCVTGSNGKSTTTAMIHAILKADAMPARLGGNIGHSLLPEAASIRPNEWIVLELSSFQLESLAVLKPRPEVAVVTNFSPNHLDRHGTLDCYREAKQQIVRWQTPAQTAVLNHDDAEVKTWPTAAAVRWFGMHEPEGENSSPLSPAEIRRILTIPGEHNVANALAAATAASVCGASAEGIFRGLRNFRGLPHRLEFVVERQGRRFFNDSKATTPDAALRAIGAFSAPICLLLGGYDKQIDLRPLAEAVSAAPVVSLALIGQTADMLDRLFEQTDPGRRICRQKFLDFASAVAWCSSPATPGRIVLLSPGSASYGWFENYEARGREFCRLVREGEPPYVSHDVSHDASHDASHEASHEASAEANRPPVSADSAERESGAGTSA